MSQLRLQARQSAGRTLPWLRQEQQAHWLPVLTESDRLRLGPELRPVQVVSLEPRDRQPERGEAKTRDGTYHDLSRTPRHAYVAFYLWLRRQGIDGVTVDADQSRRRRQEPRHQIEHR